MKVSLGEKIFYKLNYVCLTLLAISCLFPFLHIISLSFSSSHAITSGLVTIWPIEFTAVAYDNMINGTRMMSAFVNSVMITVLGVVFSMVVTIMTAYPLSRNYFYNRRFLTLALVFTMLFSGGIIPTYLIVKSLGLVNTYWALWLTGLVSTYNMLIMRTYFENIPEEIEEAARIDGCSEYRWIVQIMLPLSLPVLATITLFYGVAYWNMFLSVLLYINETAKYNMTVLVQQMIQNQSLLQELVQSGEQIDIVPESLKAAGVVLLVTPMMLVYPFLQRYFVKGVMLGAVKG